MLFSAREHSLDYVAAKLRLDLLDMIYQSEGGHIGGSFSSLDLIIAVYYSNLFNFSLKKSVRDHFILSAGHLCPALYVVLASLGYFDKKILNTYNTFGSILQGHVSAEVPGVEFSSGALGQGLSFASGLAIANKKNTIICLTSDGEHQEGQTWEAVMLAKKYRLGNLINIVDYNGMQIDGSTDDIMPLGNLAAKYVQFGWTVTTVDGHNYKQLIRALERAYNSEYPTCIIAKTVLGKGISFMENNFHYHDIKQLSQDTYLKAKYELVR